MGRPALTETVVQMFTTFLVVNMFNTFNFSLELVRFYQKSTLPLLHFVHFYSFHISGASTDNLPPGVLYKVKATYKYQAEDMDELAFEVGEIIDVIEYEDPEEQVRQWNWNMVRNMEMLTIQCYRRRDGWWESRIQQDKRVSSRPTSQSLFKLNA